MNKRVFSIVITATLGSAVLFLAGAVCFVHRNHSFNASAVRAEGTIVELIESASSDSHRRMYTPVFTYRDRNGTEYRHKSSHSSYPPIGEVGDKIEVLYDPKDPSRVKINTFFGNWGVPLILGGIGLVDAIVGLAFLAVSRSGCGRTENG